MSIKIGCYTLPSNVVLAPMAGVTDRPFRILCRRFGAGLAASEMLSADVRLWDTAAWTMQASRAPAWSRSPDLIHP
jgi:tRNA-dihydrouridine synthase